MLENGFNGAFTDMRGTPGKICRITPEGRGIVLHLAQKQAAVRIAMTKQQ